MFFGFVECQKKATYGLAIKLTLRGNKDDFVLDKAVVIAVTRIEVDRIHW